MRKRPWTRDEVRLIYRLAADGFGRQEVADELGVGLEALKKKLRRLNIRFPRGPRPDPDKRSRLMALVSLGHDTAGKLANVMGVSRKAASKLAKSLVTVGVLERTGKGRGRRLKVTRAWT